MQIVSWSSIIQRQSNPLVVLPLRPTYLILPPSSFSIISLFSLIISTTSWAFATWGGQCPFTDGCRMANLIFKVFSAAKDVPMTITSDGVQYAASSEPLLLPEFDFLQGKPLLSGKRLSGYCNTLYSIK